MPRGGKRPGAGAPKGNINALKHGGSSLLFARMLLRLAQEPAFLRLLAIYRRHGAVHPYPNATQRRHLRRIRPLLDLYLAALGFPAKQSNKTTPPTPAPSVRAVKKPQTAE